MKAKTYILMKDLPDYKAGELFSTEDGKLYVSHSVDEDGTVGKWPARFVENNLAWFKLKEDKKVAVPQEAAYREMIFHRNTKNPYSSEGQSYAAYKKGFEECWEHFFNQKEPEPTPHNIKEESGFSLNERVNIPVAFWDVLEKRIVIKKLEGVIVGLNNVSTATKINVKYFSPEKNNFEQKIFEVNQIEKIN